ncbi:MAG: hypothetical protein EBE86_011255 [Hormoscilla sp. GUM202]|nr:hypothetical protein [Hormoscilla sp. GM7CHS1pb]MBO1347931.1 hypothetical protein [Hormoscilla sp. GUM202]
MTLFAIGQTCLENLVRHHLLVPWQSQGRHAEALPTGAGGYTGNHFNSLAGSTWEGTPEALLPGAGGYTGNYFLNWSPLGDRQDRI